MSEVDTAPAKKGGWLKILLFWILGLIAVGALAVAGGGYAGYRWLEAQYVSDGPVSDDSIITIERGTGLIQAAYQLEREGLVTDARVFRVAVELLEEPDTIKTGEYLIPANASMQAIHDLLVEGESIQYPITFAEGLTSAMIVRVLEASDVLTGEIAEVPAEGTLLPETYLVTRGTSRQSLLDRMQADQTALLDALWDNRADDLPISSRAEAIILASIVEKETGVGSERAEVAGVFTNRLDRGMRLESDPTIIYGISQGEPLGRGLRRSEIDNENNAWNTYQIPRLPPTPIANPGRESLEAVLNPAETEYLFFVADGTGGHVFAETYAQHLRNVREWRRIERERRQQAN
ncbi:endolytic transglycosylase MltG [Maricaulis sp. D1M11]|uniref:endolytic transglycosylase MltG n=1 Tax=Maricaulis sp. D1M11 TaxID=3076117 RepID=UPI0039B5842C